MTSGYDYAPGSARAAYLQEHAGMSGRAGLYSGLLRFARHMNNASATAGLPALLTAAAYAENEGQQQDIMRFLGAIQAMTAAPAGIEAARAGAHVIKQAPYSMQALREVAAPVGRDVAMAQALPLIQAIASALL